MKKTVGILILVISISAMAIFVLDGIQSAINFSGHPGVTVTEMAVQWLEEILPALAIVVLVFPVSIFYLKNRELIKLQKTAFWLHFASVVLLLIGSLPMLGCYTRITCNGDGIGESILFLFFTIPAVIAFMIGLILLTITRFSKSL